MRRSVKRPSTRFSAKRVIAGPRRTSVSAAQASRELEELNRIGVALSETRDVDQLLSLILQKSRDITSADAGSLYLIERQGPTHSQGVPANGNPPSESVQLRFKLTQNDSVQFPFAEQTLPF